MSLTSNGLFHVKSRFGFHKDHLRQHSPDFEDRDKAVCYIPTRKEVFDLSMDELQPILMHWFAEAPEPLRPTQQQMKMVIDLLKLRKDRSTIAADVEALEALAKTH